MKVFIFLGPTLSSDDARAELDAIYLPPVAQGDLYRAAKEKPFAIGVVDGYFERIPAVWHKEILWALSQRIHVFGAASMGALRASELAPFGMQGVGEIFRAFHSGELEDDDEVAVAHGDASTGYRAASEAMVNIRATLAKAEQSGVLDHDDRCRLEALAKGMFYPERSFPRLLAEASQQGMPESMLDALRAFLVSGRVDQKRLDALALLHAVRDCCSAAIAPQAPIFSFQHTEAWDQVVDWAEGQPPISLDEDAVPADLLVAEVRLLGAQGRAMLANGLNRAAAGVLARRSGLKDEAERAARVDTALRQRAAIPTNGTGDDDRFERWLAAHTMTLENYECFLTRQAQFNWMKERYRDGLDRYVVDELHQTDQYLRLARRAQDKARVLRERGLSEPTLQDAGLTFESLLGWYFEQRLGCPVPVNLEEFLVDNGLSGAASLEREMLCEFMYAKLSGELKRHSKELDDGFDSGERHWPDAPA
ncbi:MAG TPA: TfuA-like protein [Polyangiaceae bacterium]